MDVMLVHLAADHRGHALARRLQEMLRALGHEVVWHGSEAIDVGDDYPVATIEAAKAVVIDADAGRPGIGLVVGGLGVGEVVAAAKVSGARPVLASDPAIVCAGREQADANVLVIAAETTTEADAEQALELFLGTPFSGALDDARRLLQVAEYESAGTIEGWTIEPDDSR